MDIWTSFNDFFKNYYISVQVFLWIYVFIPLGIYDKAIHDSAKCYMNLQSYQHSDRVF